MKIDKVIHGNSFRYTVHLIPKSMKCDVRFLSDDEKVIGEISPDFKYIILPDTYTSPYITGYGRVKVGKLKMHKYQQVDARDYNTEKL